MKLDAPSKIIRGFIPYLSGLNLGRYTEYNELFRGFTRCTLNPAIDAYSLIQSSDVIEWELWNSVVK
jgi:hypothetical protein